MYTLLTVITNSSRTADFNELGPTSSIVLREYFLVNLFASASY